MCVSTVCHGWALSVLAFLCLNRVTCFGIQFLSWSHEFAHTHTHTQACTNKESGRRVQCCRPLLLPLKMFFFLSQTSWEGYTALCGQRHSLFIFPSLLSFPHSQSTKRKREGEGEVFHLDQEGHGRTSLQRSRE